MILSEMFEMMASSDSQDLKGPCRLAVVLCASICDQVRNISGPISGSGFQLLHSMAC